MKALLNSFRIVAIVATGMLLFAFSCEKDKDDDNNNGGWWNPDWLVGTWEATTPSSVTPFENTKIRIVIEGYKLATHDTIPIGASKVYSYSGTFYWDVDGNGPWSMQFSEENYPLPDYNLIIWNCMDAVGGYTMNNISLRIGDTVQVDPWHSMDLDWGPLADDTGNPPSYLDFYGDIEIENGGSLFRADYPPDQTSTMIRFTKK